MMTCKKWIIIGCVVLVGIVVGRLAVRAFMNLLLGGTLFGGNFLWKKKKREVKECLYLFAY